MQFYFIPVFVKDLHRYKENLHLITAARRPVVI